MRALVAAFIAMLVVAPAATSKWQDTRLNQIASMFAMRPVTVVCATVEEDESLEWAWGYVKGPVKGKPLVKANSTHLRDELCQAALELNDPLLPPIVRARAVMVLVHESYHLRRWGGARDEGIVQCQAVRHWKVAARLLGATVATIADLWPVALALHFDQTQVINLWTGEKDYYEESCAVPWLEEPE